MFLKSWLMTYRVVPDAETTAIVNEAAKVTDGQHDRLQGTYLTIEPGKPIEANLGSLTTAESVLMISDRPVYVKLNNSLTPFKGRYLLLDGADVTKVVLTNTDANTAHVRLQLLGK